MDFEKQGLTYILMIIPAVFAGTVIVQGIQKLPVNPKDGKTSIGFGIFFVILIIATYFFFIQ
jgi:hypothetical protein